MGIVTMKSAWLFGSLAMLAATPLTVLATATPFLKITEADSVTTEAQEKMEVITVVAHRQPRNHSEVVGTVTVIDQERLNREMAFDIRDMVKHEPGVEVTNDAPRFGYSGFTIRGIGGNRTAVVIDNIPLGDSFSIQQFSNTGRGLTELGLVSRVEVLRGPASTLYGSKALGGVVALKLLDADDVLTSATAGSQMSLLGNTDSDRYRLHAATAWRNGDYSLLLAAATQRNSETNYAREPAAKDAIDRRQNAALIRLTKASDYRQTRISVDAIRDERESNMQAMLGFERFRLTNRLLGDDNAKQWRIVVDQEFNPLHGVARGHWRVWQQRSETDQDSYEERMAASPSAIIERRFWFRQDTSGVGADLESAFIFLERAHRFGYGFEFSHSRVSEYRDGRIFNAETLESSNVLLGERFPIRDFPKSEIIELGVYVHDEFQAWQNGPTLSPGLRWEYYELSARADPLYESAFPNAEITDLSTQAWLPKLGVLWPLVQHQLAGNIDWFAQYARGYRAPPFSDVNIGLSMPMFNIVAIPNPDLEAEKGRTIETGVRWRHQGTRAEFTVFRNHYENFIETRAALGFDPARGMLVFQSLNRDRVRIEGAEVRIRQQLGQYWQASVSGEWAQGYQSGAETRRYLAEVSPARGSLAIAWQPNLNWRWFDDYESRVYVSASEGQRRLYAADNSELFSAPGYATIDWINRWFLQDTWQVNVGLFNLTNRQYWRNSAVAGRAPDDPLLPVLAAPGRSLGISVAVHW